MAGKYEKGTASLCDKAVEIIKAGKILSLFEFSTDDFPSAFASFIW